MCLTLLQELMGRLYFEDSSDSNCVKSIILLNFVYNSRDLATYIFTTWPLQLYVYIVYKTKLLCFSTSAKPYQDPVKQRL